MLTVNLRVPFFPRHICMTERQKTEELSFSIYLQYVLESTRSSSSAGLVSPTDNPLVNRVREAAKRILGAKIHSVTRKEPVCIEILKDIISAAGLFN